MTGHFPRLLSTIALAAGVHPAIAQELLYEIEGDAPGDGFAAAVACVGDVDGDSHADFAVGSPSDDFNGSNTGRVRVYSGLTGGVIWTFDGSAGGYRFGTSVSGAGDVNSDGYADIIAGAPHGNGIGRARVFSGLDGTELYSFDGFTIDGNFGIAVAGAGDVNGDGYDDVVVGSPRDTSDGLNSGTARVYSGCDGSLLHLLAGNDSSDRFGTSVDGAGDVDGDGYDDLVVGAPRDNDVANEAGTVHVFSGLTGDRIYEIEGAASFDKLGISVSGAGDLNMDGFDDFLAGAPGEEVAGVTIGVVHAYSGLTGEELLAVHGPDTLGVWVSGAGDLNGDGQIDFAAVAIGVDDGDIINVGSVYAFSGSDGSVLYEFMSDEQNDGPSTTVSGGCDINMDGFDDLIVGVPGNGPTGKVRVFAGSNVLCPPPTNYCYASSNSVGSGATIGSTGTTTIAVNDLVLTADGVPPNGFGLFYFGATPPGSLGVFEFGNGWRCVESPVTRFPVMQADVTGSAQLAVDFGTAPASTLVPGVAWYFQYWYRDPNGGGALFNLSDGLTATFCP